MIVKSEQDVTGLRRIGGIVAMARQTMIENMRPGITTLELDQIAGRIFERHSARSAPKVMYKFPGNTCISVNNEAAHGIPGNREILNGDLVNIDVSAELDGYYADTGATVIIEPGSLTQHQICSCARSALMAAIAIAQEGRKINELGHAIEQEAKHCGFTVIKNLCGHGIGRSLHEKPHRIVNYYRRSDQFKLYEGSVLALETFISNGAEYATKAADGWTLKVPEGNLVAQFEHTVIVTKNRPIVLTE